MNTILIAACLVVVTLLLFWSLIALMKARLAALEQRFAALAAEQLAARQKDLVGLNAQNVAGLFKDLRERLLEYEKKVVAAKDVSCESALRMTENVKELQRFASVAQNYTSALLGGNKIQGNKGEEILASILEQSGLQAGVEYETQVGRAGDGGRPDVCVYDALNRRVIFIDAKMNIKDFIEAYNLPDDTVDGKKAKKAALQKHVTSIRKQIHDLNERHYAETVAPPREGYENLPIVAMFCPFNAVLEAALTEDPTLMQYAFENNVVLVTPLTLWGYLWLIAYGWKKVAAEKRIEEIQALGGEVVEKVDALLQDIEDVAAALADATATCEKLRKRAGEKGQMSVKRAAEMLKTYGAQTTKSLKVVGRDTGL